MPNVKIYLVYFVFYTSLCMSLDDLPKIRGLDVYIWNVGNVEKNALYSCNRSKLNHFIRRFCLTLFVIFSNFASFFANIWNVVLNLKGSNLLLISRLLTFARRKQFYAYDSHNFKKIENIFEYNTYIF